MKVKLILLFIGFYLLALLVTLPAATVVGFIPEQEKITVTGVTGSIWQGKAQQVNIQNNYQLQELKWHFDWSALITLRLKIAIEFVNTNGSSGEGEVGLGLSGFFAENLILDGNAPLILSYLSLPVPVNVTGDVSLVINNASQGSPYCEELDGYLVWREANILSNMGNVDLKSVDIDLTCVDGKINADLKQKSQQIESSINVLLSEGNAYHAKGSIKESPSLAPAIKDALSWLGGKNSDGAIVINLKGKL